MLELKPEHCVLEPKDIAWRVNHVAHQVHKSDFKPEVIMPILSGASLFAADLMRELWFHELDANFIPIRVKRQNNHGTPMMPPNQVAWQHLAQKRVMIVDTIHDSGHTARYVLRWLQLLDAAETSAAFLLARDMSLLPDVPCFVGLDLKKATDYYYGYGLDLNGRGRGIPGIYAMSPDASVPESIMGRQD